MEPSYPSLRKRQNADIASKIEEETIRYKQQKIQQNTHRETKEKNKAPSTSSPARSLFETTIFWWSDISVGRSYTPTWTGRFDQWSTIGPWWFSNPWFATSVKLKRRPSEGNTPHRLPFCTSVRAWLGCALVRDELRTSCTRSQRWIRRVRCDRHAGQRCLRACPSAGRTHGQCDTESTQEQSTLVLCKTDLWWVEWIMKLTCAWLTRFGLKNRLLLPFVAGIYYNARACICVFFFYVTSDAFCMEACTFFFLSFLEIRSFGCQLLQILARVKPRFGSETVHTHTSYTWRREHGTI